MTLLTVSTEEIALLLGVTRKHVTDRIVNRPDFPAPVIQLSRRTRRWAQAEVLTYLSHERTIHGNGETSEGTRKPA